MNALVTGGAGFIGSNLVDALVGEGHAVRVLDDLSSGPPDDLAPAAELVVGDVADEDAVRRCVDGVEVVFHLAAQRAVSRSVEKPLSTDTTNVHGTLTVLQAALDAGVRRVVAVSSSSVYGGAAELPTPEIAPTQPRSPYGVSKLAGEHYVRVFAELHGLEALSLRYFNVYGPRQSPRSAYAAVIPLFVRSLLEGRRPVVHGDGTQSRDFTYVSDTVAGTLGAARAPAERCRGGAYNLAAGSRYSLLEVLDTLGRILGERPDAVHVEERAGDIRHSQADIAAARRDLGFEPRVGLEEGLRRTVEWLCAS